MSKYHIRYTKEQLIEQIQLYVTNHHKIPTSAVANDPASNMATTSTFRSVFGTFSNAIIAAGYTPARILGDSINTQCTYCGENVTITNSVHVKSTSKKFFCSKSCAAIYNNTGSTQSTTTRQKISTTQKRKARSEKIPTQHKLTCIECGSSFTSTNKDTKMCSVLCRSAHRSRCSSLWLKNNRAHIRGPQHQSYLERSFEAWLVANNIVKGISGYLTEVYFYNPNTKKNGWADFVFPKLKTIIELDGTHHIKRKALDDIKDAYLNSRGWSVLRVSYKEYQNKSKLAIITQLLQPLML